MSYYTSFSIASPDGDILLYVRRIDGKVTATVSHDTKGAWEGSLNELAEALPLKQEEEEEKKCGRCHTCGERVKIVLDGEEWCDNCHDYQRPESHGWFKTGDKSKCGGN